MEQYILSIDCGTQSIRALIFDPEGNLIEKAQIPLEYESPYPGWAEQKPEYFWQRLCDVVKSLWQKDTNLKNRVIGITLTTQRGTVINVDRNGNSLRPAITWFDQRQVENPDPIPGWNLIFKLIGMSEAIDFFQRQIEASWIYKNEPEIWNKTYKFLLLSGYLSYKLTGKYIDSIACQVGYIPFDYKRHKWASKWDWKWKLVPATKEILPDLVKPGELLGKLTSSSAKELELEKGIPVIAAGSDKACETLGCGVTDDSSIHLSFGTTATVNVITKKYKEAIPFIPPYPSVIPGHYSMEIQIFRGFWLVTWFKEQFAYSEKIEAEKKKCSIEDILEEKIKYIKPGCQGLILQPYWSPGIRIPGPEARGSIIGFSDWHTKYHLYRAILEGIGFSLREGTERIENKLRKKIHRIAVGGGGSNSNIALQITADIFNRKVEKPAISEASGLGAAMIGFYGLGTYKSIQEAVKKMYKQGKIVYPNEENHKIYNEIYHNVYIKIYQKLRPIYKVLKLMV